MFMLLMMILFPTDPVMVNKTDDGFVLHLVRAEALDIRAGCDLNALELIEYEKSQMVSFNYPETENNDVDLCAAFKHQLSELPEVGRQ